MYIEPLELWSAQPIQPDAGVLLLLGKIITVHIDGAVYDVSGIGLRIYMHHLI